MAVDLYRGTIGSGISKGTLVTGPYWQLDTTGGSGSVASCFLANVPPTTCSVGCNGTSGPLDLATDPNPALGFATYYLAALNAPAPNNGSVNALGCANPGICRAGTTPGAACSANSNCGTGGTCLLAPSSAFSGSFNGCVPAGDPSKVVEQAVTASLCP